ncbi:Uncharacterized protein APZ42_007480 [Daphnia magna]|uniref:Uncharacterized protein n=1 Tax=Daphnia magna TaxID=35525 RepID=A0A164F9C3_9CRUS|nr:Uncharacterized protein APZ42_007480 [Daphnia magna]
MANDVHYANLYKKFSRLIALWKNAGVWIERSRVQILSERKQIISETVFEFLWFRFYYVDLLWTCLSGINLNHTTKIIHFYLTGFEPKELSIAVQRSTNEL